MSIINNKSIQENKSSFNTRHETFDTDLRFLLACCQTDLSESDIKTIHSFLVSNDQLPITLIYKANQHGILPLVYRSMKIYAAELISPKFMAKLKYENMSIVRKNMLMSAELIRIMKLLKENGIDALAFKGPTLAQMAYGDIALRQFGDLDILVKEENISNVDILLKQEGYKRPFTFTPVQEKIWIKNVHDLGLIHPKKGVYLELHRSFFDKDYPIQIDMKDFFKKTQKIKINGHSIPTFSNENLLFYLCIHGSKHLWERIEWVKNIDLLIRHKNIDWKKISTVLEKNSDFKVMYYFGLSFTSELFGTPLPKNITQHISDIKEIDTLSDFVLQDWQASKSVFQKTAARLKLFPGNWKRLVLLHKIILKPSLADYTFINMPKGFHWVYYLVKPYLLIKKHLTKFIHTI